MTNKCYSNTVVWSCDLDRLIKPDNIYFMCMPEEDASSVLICVSVHYNGEHHVRQMAMVCVSSIPSRPWHSDVLKHIICLESGRR